MAAESSGLAADSLGFVGLGLNRVAPAPANEKGFESAGLPKENPPSLLLAARAAKPVGALESLAFCEAPPKSEVPAPEGVPKTEVDSLDGVPKIEVEAAGAVEAACVGVPNTEELPPAPAPPKMEPDVLAPELVPKMPPPGAPGVLELPVEKENPAKGLGFSLASSLAVEVSSPSASSVESSSSPSSSSISPSGSRICLSPRSSMSFWQPASPKRLVPMYNFFMLALSLTTLTSSSPPGSLISLESMWSSSSWLCPPFRALAMAMAPSVLIKQSPRLRYVSFCRLRRASAMYLAPFSVKVLSFMLSVFRLGFLEKASARALMPSW